MFKYNLAFLKIDSKILMLNRNKSPWMGSWNGVGGKIEIGETPIESVIREIFEETNIKVEKNIIIDKGYVTWNVGNNEFQGLHLYFAEISKEHLFDNPIRTSEGILDWKEIEWISNFDNYGVCDNIPFFINDVIHNDTRYNHECIFNDRDLISVTKKELK